jgi:hypothetical protein
VSYSSSRERQALIARFERVFKAAAAQRHLRPEMVTTPTGRSEVAWVLHELTVMHDEVNQARAERGLPPVDRRLVESAEQAACGHVDYATKWPIYCAEIVMRQPTVDR